MHTHMYMHMNIRTSLKEVEDPITAASNKHCFLDIACQELYITTSTIPGTCCCYSTDRWQKSNSCITEGRRSQTAF